jgi:immune inhibitor A
MGGGSWNANGEIPAHPSAWCKANQGWVSVINRTGSGVVTIRDVKSDRKVYRLWQRGEAGHEYFLVENRGRTLYDRELPGSGLLVYHVDESVDGNEDENHPFIKLLEADGLKHLHEGANRGDAGDPYPGSSKNVILNAGSNPGSASYAGLDTSVTITDIKASRAGITARLGVVGASRQKPVSTPTRRKTAKRRRANSAARKATGRKRAPGKRRRRADR